MQSSFKNILVPTDFSEQGNNAIKTAISLCKQHNAVLHLMHVVESRYIVNAPQPNFALQSIAKEIDRDSRNRLYNVFENVIREHHIPVQIHMPTGIPFDEICKASTEMPIDLIVMGTHGASGVREFFMGTTAYSVIKNTTKPVLTIPANFDKQIFDKILFPVRPVNGIKEKYEFIKSLAKAADVTIHFATLCLPEEEELLAIQKEEIKKIEASICKSEFIFSNEIYLCKNFAQKVLEVCDAINADLIVINATLDYKWTQFFVGPYTQQVVNHAKVPVLSFTNAVNVTAEVEKIKINMQELLN
jgi:nucleotide-binding universal stress UspA family protein